MRGSRLGNNGRFVASRPGEEAETLVSGRFSVTDEADYFRMADTGVGPDFVEMRPGAGYDLVRYMPEDLRVGDKR